MMTDSLQTSDRRALLQNALQAIESLQAKLDALQYAQKEPIAVVGMSCRFPGGANDPDTYWQLLREGRDAIREVPPERWDVNEYANLDDEHPPRWFGGFLDNVDQFDPSFFGISPREAASMDPQQRLVLEVSWEALERSGIIPETLFNSLSGVYIGITTNDYSRISMQVGPDKMDAYTATGSALNVAAGRVAYTLGLHGPTMAVDTACSSSLTAIHLACQSLRSRESDLALAGGVNVLLNPEPFIMFSRWGMMAPDGRCKTFDAAANGFVRAEGCGMLVLKRLKDAQAAGDPILALIRGSAVNEDGKSSGLTVPNGLAQQAVVQAALDAAGLLPNQISYVETHGTGTALGDPIEVEALGAALGQDRKMPLTIGSVKTNIGHAESASGVAGLIKAILAIQHREFPPHIHFKERSPRIPWPKFPIEIPTQCTPWQCDNEPRRAGVSSFGFSGVNAHVIVEEPPSSPEEPPSSPETLLGNQQLERDEKPFELLTTSARSEAALNAYAHKLAEHFTANPALSLTDAAHTLANARTRYSHRLAIPATSPTEAAEKLTNFLANPLPQSKEKPQIAFLFTGQGAQYEDMGYQLYKNEPVFRSALDRCTEILTPILNQSILNIIYPTHQSSSQSTTQSSINETQFTQPAIFAIEYALAELWKSWGVIPQWVMGHSVGEYTAAVVAGVMSLEDGLKLIAARGRLMGNLPTGGEMAAIFGELSQVEAAIQPYVDRVSIAAINGPESIVISGEGTTVQKILAELASKGIKSKALTVSHAFHSPLMEPILDEFEQVIEEIQMQTPHITLLSNVTAQPAGEEVTQAFYWRQHVRQPVRFAESVTALHKLGCNTFIEIGPHPTLLSMAQRCLPGKDDILWLPSLRKSRNDAQTILTSLGELYACGVDINWQTLTSSEARRISLPTYPFQRERYWVETQRPTKHRAYVGSHPLLGPRLDLAPTPGVHIWQGKLELAHLRYLDDHRVQNSPILPLTAYIEMANAAAVEIFGPGPISITEVKIEKMLLLPEEAAPLVQVTLKQQADGSLQFQVFSRPTRDDDKYLPQEKWTLHALGKLSHLDENEPPHLLDQLDLETIQARCNEELSGVEFYQRLSEKGNQWGKSFQGVEHLWRRDGEALSQVKPPDTLVDGLTAYQFHPALSDSSGHVLTATISMEKSTDSQGGAFVGGGVEKTYIYRPFRGKYLWAYARLRPPNEQEENVLIGDVAVFDENGTLVSESLGARLWYLDTQKQHKLVERANDWLYEFNWQKISIPSLSATPPARNWLLLADHQGYGKALAAHLLENGQHVIQVETGEHFQQISEDTFKINSTEPKDFEKLLSTTPSLQGIIHLWSLDAPNTGELSVEKLMSFQEHSLGSVLHLVQSLNQTRPTTPPRLWLITRGAMPSPTRNEETGSLDISQSALWGLGRTLAAEHSELWGGLVDLAPSMPPTDIANLLWPTLNTKDGEDQVAFYKAQRYGLRLVRSQIQASHPIRVHDDATYLITGGLGGLGRVVAGWLVSRGARHLVLMNRTPLPPHAEWGTVEPESRQAAQIADLQAMEAQGAQVYPAAVDVADRNALQEFLDEFQTLGWPPIKGVIHAAGTMQYQPLRDHSLEAMRALLRPKIAGAWNLHALLQDQPIDLFVLFSSTSVLLSSPLMGSYAAGNAFLDSLAHYRQSLGQTALSINWGTWSEAGMAVDFADNERNRQAITVASTLTNTQALQAFELLLEQDSPQVGVMPMDWATWQKQYPAFTKVPLLSLLLQPEAEESKATRPHLDRAELNSAPVEKRQTLLQNYLVAQTAVILGFSPDKLDASLSISTLGLDSLMAVELKNRIETDLGVVIPMMQLLEGPSVSQLTNLVQEKLSTLASEDEPASQEIAWEEGEI